MTSLTSIASASDDTPVTVKVYFDIEHDNKDVGRIVMGPQYNGITSLSSLDQSDSLRAANCSSRLGLYQIVDNKASIISQPYFERRNFDSFGARESQNQGTQQQVRDSRGTYLVLMTNKNNEVAGVYVGRTNSLQRRMKDHQINLAIATHTSDSFAHIESHFYQSAARELHHGGELYFIAANIFPITSQGEFSSDFSQSQPNFHLHDFFLTIAIDAHDHVAVFEALLSCITGTFQLKEAFLEFRAGFGMPLVSFIGYNSTPCMERPERVNQYAENVANSTLSPMILELRNLYLRAAHAARHDDQKKEIEQDYRHKHAAYMMEVARLLKKWSANVSNDSGLPLFVSLQLLVGDPDSASDVFLGTSPKYGEIYGGLKLYLKDLDYFVELVFGSSCPLWDGSGFSAEVSTPLKGVGMTLYSATLNTWIPKSANFRFREVLSRFTVFASQAAMIARQSCTFDNGQEAPNHTSEPESDDEEDVPEFQIFQRTLPSTGYLPRIGVRGQRSPTILIPSWMLRMWFPDGIYPQGLPPSVKIEAKRARSPDEVKIFLRLDSTGQSDNEGMWFNALRYAKDGLPPAQFGATFKTFKVECEILMKKVKSTRCCRPIAKI
ncbi:hypothetical protein L7F22_044257 [Adiantum nelumboides]|nr:hypothetical protein [Adiantum nelumboides]